MSVRCFVVSAVLAGLVPAGQGSEQAAQNPREAIIDVTAAPYNAQGDGRTDDTRAIQQALRDYADKGVIIYLPNGTYLISKTLRWGANQKLTTLQGQSRAGTILRLKDACPGFTDPGQPAAMVWTGDKPVQRFRHQIRNCTWDTGRGNPGAIGVRFNASNCGCLRDVAVRSQEQPAFVIEDSQASLSITEANFSNNAYRSLVQLKQHGATVSELRRGQTPGSAGGSLIPLWSTP